MWINSEIVLFRGMILKLDYAFDFFEYVINPEMKTTLYQKHGGIFEWFDVCYPPQPRETAHSLSYSTLAAFSCDTPPEIHLSSVSAHPLHT